MLDDVSCICKVVSASIFMRDHVLEPRENTIYLLLLQCSKQHLWLLWSQIVLKGMQGKSWNGVQIHVMILILVYSSLVFTVYSLILATEQCGKQRRAFSGPFSLSAFFFTASAMCPPGELTCKFLGDPPVTTFHLVLETMQLCKNDSCQVRIVIWVVETQTQVISYRQTNTFAFWTISPDQLLVIFN